MIHFTSVSPIYVPQKVSATELVKCQKTTIKCQMLVSEVRN